MDKIVGAFLGTLNISPVLLDVGASGEPPPYWKSIAGHSVYVGFDPDRREMRDIRDGQFARSVIVNEAVTDVPGKKVQFYLTSYPYCSSTLPPDTASLEDYFFSDLFVVEDRVSMPATSLNTVIDRLGLDCVDWFKTDSQGTDLRLFLSLDDRLRDTVLAVDIEPGLIDAYEGEDLFVDAHRELLRQGFWLCTLNVFGSVRLKRRTVRNLLERSVELNDGVINAAIKTSPGWCEARYLRTTKSLANMGADARRYQLLWVFAITEGQWGYALDVADAYEKRFGGGDISKQMFDVPLKKILAFRPSRMRTIAGKFIPKPIKQQLKRFLKSTVLK